MYRQRVRKNYRKRNYRKRIYPSKMDRTKKLVDGKGPSRLELMAKKYVGPIGTLAKTVYGISQIINSEHKYIDSTGVLTPDSTGTTFNLSLVAQGTTDITRIGNSIKFDDLYFKFVCNINGSATNSFLRIMLLVDKELDGALPSVANILQAVTTVSPINQDFSKRFTVLKSMNYALSANSSISAISDQFYIKLPFHGYYDGTGAVIADCKENQIICLLLSDQATNKPSFQYHSRIHFTDT